MADLGNSSQADTAHKHKVTSWIAVVLIAVSTVVLGIAFVLQSIPLAVIGVLIGVAGAGVAVVYGLMEDAH